MFKNFTVIAILLLITSGAGFAQSNFTKGYVVLAHGDTISGLVDDRGEFRNSQQITFKATGTSEEKQYQPADLISYQVGGHIYRSTQITHQGQPQTVFLELINDGHLRLFYWKDSKDKQYLYVQQDSALLELTNEKKTIKQNGKKYAFYAKGYVNTLNTVAGDCGEAATEDLKFNLKAIAAYVAAYNTCKGGVAYTSEKPSIRARITKSIYAGINQSSVATVGSARFSETNTRTGLNAGVGLHIGFPNNKFFFDLLAEYNRKGAEAVAERINFDLHYLNISPGISYVYPKGKLRPMVGIGFTAGYLVSSKESAYTRMRYEKQVRLFDNTVENDEVPYEVGFEAKAGVKYALVNNLNLVLKARFSKTLIPFNFGSSIYYNHVASLQAGLEF
ncbi:outer membrane beta-barrel protein [Pontibacter beigongshangensis]|uniref:outer membrane beta-barrel protein n=1 Tax=Pontibacter beigongshangensis TaxID=2574733 RepID=UPI00164F81BF|nr:outer membrane beta-barrel protein [Pontibacter beigongshangensis]